MSFIGDLLNGSKGAGFQAQGTDIAKPATAGQYNQQFGQAQGALGQQQSFLNALGAQGGIGNQANVFQQQQQLANQLGQQAMGGGPNPALAQLQGTTGQNISNQAAMMAGQRGGGANAGLMARQIGNMGANVQQQAGNQAAVLRAQQKHSLACWAVCLVDLVALLVEWLTVELCKVMQTVVPCLSKALSRIHSWESLQPDLTQQCQGKQKIQWKKADRESAKPWQDSHLKP
jgi:hypothetical protein